MSANGPISTDEKRERMHEAYDVHGHIRCDACDGDKIDLSDADSFSEAVNTVNEHFVKEHPVTGARGEHTGGQR